MESKKELEEYFENKYFNEDENYKEIISKINRENRMSKIRILKTVATFIIVIIGMTGIVIAGTKIYNTYIKKAADIDSSKMFMIEEGEHKGYYSTEILNDMKWEEETNLYYKIITDEKVYNEYKNKINELPENSEIDFNNEFIIIITGGVGEKAYLHKKDLEILEITADDTTTYVILSPKEDSNYDKINSSLYVVANKVLLKDEIEFKIDMSGIKLENVIPINNLPDSYSKEEAIKDGCMVIERVKEGELLQDEFEVISENKYALDELIEKSKKGIESHLRIYYDDGQRNNIFDIQYKNNMFVIDAGYPGNKAVKTITCKYITKEYWRNDTYIYGYSDINRAIDANILLFATIN